jgi:hypothetical protein
VPRWVRAIPSGHPRCRVCHHPHAPNDWHLGSPDDWSPAATEAEANERAAELFRREFPDAYTDPQTSPYLRREDSRIRVESPELSLPQRLEQLAVALRARGLSRS